ncbi:MAG: alpha/beta fold hydrolase BchO [Anderseniella sp.]|jgi:magnesium chelatase accessory protein|nr:alpha/beta fold hydrolase BchO [Anderseniella sp.]
MYPGTKGLDWEEQRATWPHARSSRFVLADRVRFHVQVSGSGPVLLLLHGTGASSHSWRKLLQALKDRFTVVMPDLPGHGFSSMPALERVSLGSYAQLVGALLRELDMTPAIIAGHSAGAAIAAQMTMAGEAAPRGIVSFNGAFVPMGGAGDLFFSPLAKMLSVNPLMPRLFAWRAGSRRVVQGLIEGTGSHLDDEGLDLYQRLMTSPAHCSAALQMMARWDLHDMVDRMAAGLACPVLLVVGERDKAIPMRDAQVIAGRMDKAELVVMRDAGHVAHEEHPDEAVGLIVDAWAGWSGSKPASAEPRAMEDMAC